MINQQEERISVLIITYNEIGYIEKCIESVAFADEILVVDSFSDDGTYEYLKEHPKVKVLQHPFKDFTTQKSYALELASYDWILFVDADEVLPVALQNEVQQTVRTADNNFAAYWFYRVFMFEGRPLKFSGTQTDKNIRLFRKSKVSFTPERLVHETLEVNGAIGSLKEKLIHYCFKNYSDYKTKITKYGVLKAQQDFNKNKRFSYFRLVTNPFWKFFQKYIIRLGFLDGRRGVILCYLNALGQYERYRELRRLGSG